MYCTVDRTLLCAHLKQACLYSSQDTAYICVRCVATVWRTICCSQGTLSIHINAAASVNSCVHSLCVLQCGTCACVVRNASPECLTHLQREEWKTLRSQRKGKQDLLDLQLQVETEVQAKKNIQAKLTKATKDLTDTEKCVAFFIIILCPVPHYPLHAITLVPCIPALLLWPCMYSCLPTSTVLLTLQLPTLLCTHANIAWTIKSLFPHSSYLPRPSPQETPRSRHREGAAPEPSNSTAAGLETSQDGRYIHTRIWHIIECIKYHSM